MCWSGSATSCRKIVESGMQDVEVVLQLYGAAAVRISEAESRLITDEHEPWR